ncbi:MAG: hypothetical protein QG566_662 [Patescibacteria group bacterium]|nr:hypothetical protein [Patescibacteria group bacterium]
MFDIEKLQFGIMVVFIVMWVLLWKGYAVWTAAQNKDKRWFIVLLVVNTFSILDIIYIFAVAKKTGSDIKQLMKSKI